MKNKTRKENTKVTCFPGKYVMMILFLSCLPFHTFGQAGGRMEISGTVTDTYGEALIGVSVTQEGTANGTITDFNGQFRISVNPNSTLRFSYIGYKTVERKVTRETTVAIQLEEERQLLDEVVVVGYGTVKKKDLTGSVASISSDKITESPTLTAAQALQGKVAGVLVTNSNWKPGASASVLIRGKRSINASNDPLYVVDGIPITGALDEIPPGDIESIDVLKDASATAIYGSRGANGVILITTKKGRSGKIQVEYNGYYGAQTIQNKLELMNGAQYADYIRESYRASGDYSSVVPNKEEDYKISGAFGGNTNAQLGPSDPYTWAVIEGAYDANGNYDPSKVRGEAEGWQDAVERTGMVTDHQLSIRGGGDKTQFSFGATYFRNEGIYKTHDYTRYSIRLNLDTDVTKWLKVGGHTQYSNSVNQRGNDFQNSWRVNPLGRLYDDNGDLVDCTVGVDTQYWNPLHYLQEGAIVSPKTVNRFLGSYYGEIKLPLEGLKYRLNAGIDYYGVLDQTFQSGKARQNQVNQAKNNTSNSCTYTIENLLFYDKQVGDHSFGATALQSIQRSRGQNLDMTVQDVPSDDLLFNDMGSANTLSSYGSNNQMWSLASFMGRINYNYKSKYYATVSMRYDGSSRLAEGHQWVFFPAFALAWRINEEGFLRDKEYIDNLKLRFGYGVTANTSINPYQTKGLLDKKYYNYGNNLVIGYAPGSLPDNTQTWENTGQWNLGFDSTFLRVRINGTIDAYLQNTSDLLLQRQLPVVSGYSSVLTNVGKTQNKGIELTLSTVNIQHPNFTWSTDFMMSTNKEKIVELYNGKEDDIGNSWFIGEALNVYYDYKKIGIWQDTPEDIAEMEKFNENGHSFKPGMIRLEDVDGDYRITSDKDRMILGHNRPSYILNLGNTFTYKQFDLNIIAYAALGGMVRHDIRYNHQSHRNNNVVYDYWTPDNPTNAFPRPNRNIDNIEFESTLYYEKSDFLRIKTMTLGYTLPQKVVNKMTLSRFRVYFTAQNPFVFTGFSGVDPEGATGYASPSVSSWIVGANISF